MTAISEFKTTLSALEVLSDEKGWTSGFIVHVGKIELKIQAAENKEADEKTATALLVWLARNANKLAGLFKNCGSTYKGEVEINILPLAGFEKEVGGLFPYDGLTLEELKAQVLENGVKAMLAHPNVIYLVVRDDLEKEYFKDTNRMERIIFGIVTYSLLLLVCGMTENTAEEVSVKFVSTLIPLKPKIPTHAAAQALIEAKKGAID